MVRVWLSVWRDAGGRLERPAPASLRVTLIGDGCASSVTPSASELWSAGMAR